MTRIDFDTIASTAAASFVALTATLMLFAAATVPHAVSFVA